VKLSAGSTHIAALAVPVVTPVSAPSATQVPTSVPTATIPAPVQAAPLAKSPDMQQSSASSAAVGGGVGGGFAAALLIAGIIAFVVIRRKKNREKSDTTEHASSPASDDASNGATTYGNMGETNKPKRNPKEGKQNQYGGLAAKPSSEKEDNSSSDSSSASGSGGAEMAARQAKALEGFKPEWMIPFEDLTFEKKIGQGAFGMVYKGKWRKRTAVAIKQSSFMAVDESQLEAFKKEAILMLSLRNRTLSVTFRTKRTHCLIDTYPRYRSKYRASSWSFRARNQRVSRHGFLQRGVVRRRADKEGFHT
jgi:hypothetical protein